MSTVFHDYIPLRWTQGSVSAGITVATASATFAATVVPYKCQVRRWAVVQDNNATGGTYTFYGNTTATVLATLTKPASDISATPYLYKDPTTSVVLNEGDVVLIGASAVSGVIRPIVLIERMPEVPANQAKMLASA